MRPSFGCGPGPGAASEAADWTGCARSPTATPFIPLNGGQITFRFDDLEADYKNYNLRVVHCSHDWWPSELHPSEYLDGFYEISITDIEDSFGTKVNYTHYEVECLVLIWFGLGAAITV